jgi:hypothetical protein
VKRRLRSGLAACSIALAGAAAPRAALGRSAKVVPYPTSDVWPAAVRFLRVDRDYPVKEKDEAAGYVLFEMTENKRAYRAALELVRTTDNEGRSATQLYCTVQELPRRYEETLLDKLATKLRDERGPPAPPPAHDAPAAGEPPAAPAPKDREQKPPVIDPSTLPGPPSWGPGESR